MLFLAATTTGMSIQASAYYEEDNEDYYSDDRRSGYSEQENSYYGDNSYSSDSSYGDMYSKYPTKDKKEVCKYGPFKGFYVIDKKFCDVKPPQPPNPPIDEQILCEECFKYWLHFLNRLQAANFVNAFADAINDLRFGETGCTGPTADEDCLPVINPVSTPNISQLAQLYEICEALFALFDEENVTFDELETEVRGGISGQPQEQVLIGLIECLENSWYPVAFPTTNSV
jgi:hypothetical protein